MKKLLVSLLIMAMSTTLLIGCGGNDNADTGNENQEVDIVVEDNTGDVEIEAVVDLAGYIAPTGLGEDLSSLTFKLVGNYYQFPMPVSAFLDNGWVIPETYQTDSLIQPGETYQMALRYEGPSADAAIALHEMVIMNKTDVPLSIEECMVYRMIVVSEYMEYCNEYFALPEGIDFDSTLDELKAVTEQGGIQQNGNYTTCCWDNEAWTESIMVWYHPEKNVEYFEMLSW